MTVGVGQFVDIFGDRLQEPADINLLEPGWLSAMRMFCRLKSALVSRRLAASSASFPFDSRKVCCTALSRRVLAQDEQHASDCREGEKKGQKDQRDVHRAQTGIALAVRLLDLGQNRHVAPRTDGRIVGLRVVDRNADTPHRPCGVARRSSSSATPPKAP